MYDEINIMEEIGANYGWDIIEGWTCINQSLELYATTHSLIPWWAWLTLTRSLISTSARLGAPT
jgi:hypothetical protein